MAASDFITLAFISALRSYQQDHQQEPTYSLAKLQELEDKHTKDLLEDQQQAMQEVPAVGGIAVSGAEHQQSGCEFLSQADTSEIGAQQTAEVPPSEQSDRHMPQMATAAQHAAEEAQQVSGSHNRVRYRYTREQMLQLQPQQQTAQHSNTTAAANTPAKLSATKPANNSIEQQPQQNYEQQQQQWYSQYYWGPYSYWDGSSWTTSASPAAAAAAAAAPGGWDWSSSGYQQHTDGAQQQQQQAVSAPPAAPPLPPAYPHCCGAAIEQPQACTMCGKAINTAAALVGTAVRDQEAVRSALMSQIPRDIADIPESLAAAEAAIVKTVALSQTAECRNSMPELMMAWFYVGYHAGKLSSGGPGSSSSSRPAGHEVKKSAGGVAAVIE